jgi:hypothetical protein
LSNSAQDRIAAAFERELAGSPVPPSLRARSVHAAVVSPRRQSRQPMLLALVAAVLAFAVVVTLVVGSHLLRANPVPAGSTVPPTLRGGAAAAYDQAHGVMVLFGGNGTPPLNETWTWDGKYWRHQHPSATPPARQGAMMAYDSARHEVVLFGGMALVGANSTAVASIGDTWTWNRSTWREKHPPHEPAIGFDWQSPAMGFDPISRTVLLYGFTTSYQAQTWSWNGSDWTLLRPSTTPTSAGTMASDRHELLLLAATPGQVGGRYFTQTWAWDGSNWNLLNPKVNLPLLGFVSAAYDPERAQLVLLTGDTWTWDGSTWSRQHPALQPPSVGYMVYMSSLHEVVSWGDVSSSQDNQMFAWDGTTWKLIEPGTAVPPSGSNGKGGVVGWVTPAAAETIIRASVTSTRPVLLPQSFPGAFDALLPSTSPDSFVVVYESDLRDKTITLSIGVPNPPPATGPSARLTTVAFRGVTAQYQVYDASSPLSQRWLMWNEPGTMANPQTKGPGVPYFLSSDGLTDQEFWQIANSLK